MSTDTTVRVWRAQKRIERWLVDQFGRGVMGDKARGISAGR
jgi:hypothetical protein